MASPKWLEAHERVSESLQRLRARIARHDGAADAAEQNPSSRTAQHEVGASERAVERAVCDGVNLSLEILEALLSERATPATRCSHATVIRFASPIEARGQRYAAFKRGILHGLETARDIGSEQTAPGWHAAASAHARQDNDAGDVMWCVSCGAVRVPTMSVLWAMPGSPQALEVLERTAIPVEPDDMNKPDAGDVPPAGGFDNG